jgi:vacuolar-type H+-ATPase subunit E/Vma4
MSLENILQALEAEAEQKIATIDRQARAEVEKIVAQARTEAAAIRRQHLEAAHVRLRTEQARILNQAKQKALQRVQGTREELMRVALEQAAEGLAALSNTEKYESVLRQLVKESIDTLGGPGPLKLWVQDQDVELTEQITAEMGVPAMVEADLASEDLWGAELGGLIAATPDGRIRLINTLETRLQRVATLYRAQIAEMILNHHE